MKPFLLTIVVLLIAENLCGQEIQTHKSVFPGGISVEGGLGLYSIRDEYISHEKYSGTLECITISWSRFHEKHGFRVTLDLRRADEIENNNITGNAKQALFRQDYIYPIGAFQLISKKVFAYIGPTMEIFLYYLEYDFAHNNRVDADANGSLFSMGCISEFIWVIKKELQVESAIRLSLVSIGAKSFDENRYDDSAPKLFTLISAMNSSVDVAFRYYLMKSVSVKAGYNFQLDRINAWDPFISSSDNLSAGVTYHF